MIEGYRLAILVGLTANLAMGQGDAKTPKVDKKDSLRIACVQMDIVPGKLAENLENIRVLTAKAAKEGARLVVFPEGATADYYDVDFASMAAPIPGEQSEFLCRLAKQHQVWLAVGVVERGEHGLYNTALLISPDGKIAGKYCKTHLSVDSRGGTIKKEADVFLPGRELPVFETPLGKIGIMICKDGDFPEVPRVLAVKGAELILWMTNRGGVAKPSASFYATTNKVIVVTANRAKGHAAGGLSGIWDQSGRPMIEAGKEQTILYADADLKRLRQARQRYWNVNRLRRPELYEPIAKIVSPIP